jgi:hypothetical protein
MGSTGKKRRDDVVGRRSVRGDVNVILNRLVREGMIASFETSFNDREATGRARVTITPASTVDPEAVKRTVAAALEPFSGAITVTVKAG